MSEISKSEHSELLFALGAMHSDIKHVMGDVEQMKVGMTDRLDGHSRRIASLEATRVRLIAYAAGLSAGIFTLGSILKDKLFT